MGKVTWNDIQEASYKELKKTYKVNDRQLENQIRTHLDGSNAKERRDTYEKVYGNKK